LPGSPASPEWAGRPRPVKIIVSSPSRHRRTRRQRKRLYHALVLIGVGGLFALVSLLVQPFYGINLWVSDQLFLSQPPNQNIVIAGIDDKTLATYGRWADWRRSLHAQAIDNLANAGAKVIGYDVIFTDTGNSSDDETLATAIANAGNVVLADVGTQPVSQGGGEVAYSDFLEPVAPLEQAASSVGHANVVPDGDGTVRRIPLIIRSTSGQVYPSLTLAVLYREFSLPLPQDYPLEDGTVNLVMRNVPVDSSYNLRINFSADNKQRPYISYGDIISGNFDPSLVKNKIVLVGMTATGELDAFSVPTSASKIPGVYIHAGAIDTILTQRFLREPGPVVPPVIMLVLVGITAAALPRLGTRHWTDIAKGLGLTIGLFIAVLVGGFIAFDRGYILNLLYPLLLLPVAYVGNIVYIVVAEQRDKRFVKELFGRYISPQIAQEIVTRADAGDLQLGGEQREVSVFFADIRNFTAIAEQLSPEAVMQMLNSYLAVIADAVVENHGIVNKFVGDNIMAVWNAPQSQPDHALLAVKAAWEAQLKLAELRQKDNRPIPIQFGIGVNTGVAVAGNVGSAGRSEYTVIGDSVNTASRICSNTPGDQVRIGAETYSQAKDHLEAEQLEPQQVKGKAAPVTVYRVISLHLSNPPEQK
jgi:adenylate cyclase